MSGIAVDEVNSIGHMEMLVKRRVVARDTSPPIFRDIDSIFEVYTGYITVQLQGSSGDYTSYLPISPGFGYDYKSRNSIDSTTAVVTPASTRYYAAGIAAVDDVSVELNREQRPGVAGDLWFLYLTMSVEAQAAILVKVNYHVTVLRNDFGAGSPALPKGMGLQGAPQV